MITIPAGWFLMGSVRKDDDPFGLETPYDDTEQPQRRIWLDAYAIDRDEVSMSSYLAYLATQRQPIPEGLQRMLKHVLVVHGYSDEHVARWPAVFADWSEAMAVCRFEGKRLPTEAEWEKAARGTDGNIFPWGRANPDRRLAVFGHYHVHEIPMVDPVDQGESGRSPYGLHHMAGNVGEWVHDWLGLDYYATMPDRNPPGPSTGRYRGVRGGSWKSKPEMLRSATRGGASPEQRTATIGFRCARSLP
jgi:iron(II)-dependent oxidoreductase